MPPAKADLFIFSLSFFPRSFDFHLKVRVLAFLNLELNPVAYLLKR